MINRKRNPVAWALLLTELDEAREHFEHLIETMTRFFSRFPGDLEPVG